ncbi:hypothetical protein AAFF_G00075910 [Aldrovandia affinis]|uniref:Uncharacterized protein n=1 Tax=Aldrovandia affinis TaxID=143900 RepID=A0AAD7S0P3_9TELE|nr:hypothetical protein AAFF_G00075910 [Aldrovandia affinis]
MKSGEASCGLHHTRSGSASRSDGLTTTPHGRPQRGPLTDKHSIFVLASLGSVQSPELEDLVDTRLTRLRQLMNFSKPQPPTEENLPSSHRTHAAGLRGRRELLFGHLRNTHTPVWPSGNL